MNTLEKFEILHTLQKRTKKENGEYSMTIFLNQKGKFTIELWSLDKYYFIEEDDKPFDKLVIDIGSKLLS